MLHFVRIIFVFVLSCLLGDAFGWQKQHQRGYPFPGDEAATVNIGLIKNRIFYPIRIYFIQLNEWTEKTSTVKQ